MEEKEEKEEKEFFYFFFSGEFFPWSGLLFLGYRGSAVSKRHTSSWTTSARFSHLTLPDAALFRLV